MSRIRSSGLAENITLTRPDSITWENITWESLTWESVTWESLTWERHE